MSRYEWIKWKTMKILSQQHKSARQWSISVQNYMWIGWKISSGKLNENCNEDYRKIELWWIQNIAILPNSGIK